MTQDDLWRLVQREVGGKVPEWVRESCRETGSVGRFMSSKSKEALTAAFLTVVGEAREFLRLRSDWEEDSREGEAPAEVLTPVPTTDERWQLLADLGQRYLMKFGDAPEWRPVLAPVYVAQDHEGAISWPYSAWDGLPRVRIDFDPRMGQTDLFELLRKVWTELATPQDRGGRGWLKPTHRFSDRTLALLRFVCLECEEDWPWRKRLKKWNDEYGQRTLRTGETWAYKQEWVMSKDFHRAEVTLTGQKNGLAELYTSREKLEQEGQKRVARRLAELVELKGKSDDERRRIEMERREKRATARLNAALAQEARAAGPKGKS